MIKNHRVLLYLASLWVAMVACQGKSEGLTYKSTGSVGKIKDIVLSSENKVYALKTTDAKIAGVEYPIWVGNTDNWGPAFSSPWMTNAAPSCAFFKDKLYIAPKAETNYLYRVDVGRGQVPHVKSADLLTFDAQGQTKMQAPYLYATTNNLYAIEDTANGIQVYTLGENDNQSLSLVNSFSVTNSVSNSVNKIQTTHIKDIVSKNINGEDCLYILTTNGSQTANLWLVKTKSNTGEECITPKKWWSEYNEDWNFTPRFDHTTSIAVHGDTLLSANANIANDGEDEQLGFGFPIGYDGGLGSAEVYFPSETLRTSAIGSDQRTYYAETIDSQEENTDYFFVKRASAPLKDYYGGDLYPNQSRHRHGEAVYKFITRKEGEIFAISQSHVYRIKEN